VAGGKSPDGSRRTACITGFAVPFALPARAVPLASPAYAVAAIFETYESQRAALKFV